MSDRRYIKTNNWYVWRAKYYPSFTLSNGRAMEAYYNFVTGNTIVLEDDIVRKRETDDKW